MHRLTFKFAVSASWLNSDDWPAVVPLLLTGAAWTTNPGPGLRAMAGLMPATWSVRGFLLQEDLTFDLSDDELYALDSRSGLDPVAINFKLHATLLGDAEGIDPVSGQDFDIHSPRSRWIELLDSVGAGVGITLRVPNPLTNADQSRPTANDHTKASLAQAAERLREARRQLRDRHWEQSVGICRKVLEKISELVTRPTAKICLRGQPTASNQGTTVGGDLLRHVLAHERCASRHGQDHFHAGRRRGDPCHGGAAAHPHQLMPSRRQSDSGDTTGIAGRDPIEAAMQY